MQQEVKDFLTVCDSECIQVAVVYWERQHQCQRCLQDQLTDSQGWNHHWPEFGGVGVIKREEVKLNKLLSITTHLILLQSTLLRQQSSFSLRLIQPWCHKEH